MGQNKRRKEWERERGQNAKRQTSDNDSVKSIHWAKKRQKLEYIKSMIVCISLAEMSHKMESAKPAIECIQWRENGINDWPYACVRLSLEKNKRKKKWISIGQQYFPFSQKINHLLNMSVYFLKYCLLFDRSLRNKSAKKCGRDSDTMNWMREIQIGWEKSIEWIRLKWLRMLNAKKHSTFKLNCRYKLCEPQNTKSTPLLAHLLLYHWLRTLFLKEPKKRITAMNEISLRVFLFYFLHTFTVIIFNVHEQIYFSFAGS